jgi:hypothetical protein
MNEYDAAGTKHASGAGPHQSAACTLPAHARLCVLFDFYTHAFQKWRCGVTPPVFAGL